MNMQAEIVKVDILQPQPQRFAHSQARVVQQARYQPVNALHMTEQTGNLVKAED